MVAPIFRYEFFDFSETCFRQSFPHPKQFVWTSGNFPRDTKDASTFWQNRLILAIIVSGLIHYVSQPKFAGVIKCLSNFRVL